MKTPILSILFCATLLLAGSCKKDPKADKLDVVEVVKDSTNVAVEEVVEEKKPEKPKKKKATKKKTVETKEKTTRIPGTSFSTDNSFAKKYIKDYERYVANYKKAVEANDMDSFLKLSDASSSLSKQYTRLISVLPGEEIEKLSKYMQVKSDQLTKLSEKM
ncbi:hypothetical protein [Aquimarina aquimarini]|uniref:hypothetical protein n=1 Tax=Aquimarina aquimarini TaxID=1191734 RepID=UPI000D55A5FE|nr:hypothetical protein [Aquimarina aquimarini]